MTTLETRPDGAGRRRPRGPHPRRAVGAVLAAMVAALMLVVPAGPAVAAAPGPQPTGPLKLTVEVPGSPEAPPTSTPAPSATATEPPAANPSGGGGLPRTGQSIVSVILVGAVLLTVGIIARRVGRRRGRDVGQVT